ncbi:hypothetical protein FEM01_13585 [Pseudomonas mosselii]|uniref:Uncharacterized protein n=1 Tax=Pseudomonas mosselii TaxID=78327 RepID=A0A5R8Z4F8_9PSED|nr:hypothetical protein FEM01_13585 [Pseudomonas mosselii]
MAPALPVFAGKPAPTGTALDSGFAQSCGRLPIPLGCAVAQRTDFANPLLQGPRLRPWWRASVPRRGSVEHHTSGCTRG